MKLFSADISDLRSLYTNNLKKALDMEIRIIKALLNLIEHSTDSELADAFANHLEQTKGHVVAIESLLRANLGEAEAATCQVMGSLTREVDDMIKDITDSSVCDIALIGAAQQVEHHEIAIYGTLRRWADLLGLEDDAVILDAIEAEERSADESLTQISERVNLVAAA